MESKSVKQYIKATLTFLLVLSFSALSPCRGELSSFDVKKILDNGTVIICREIKGSPLVTIQVRVMSGLSNEGEYAGTGISHFLEHLLFKGTNSKSADEIRMEIKSMGGIVNGSTGMDSAEYHITVPNSYFSEASELLIDMVMEPVFTDNDLISERNVILNEINMRNDDPVSRRINLLFRAAYLEHIYKHPVIGNKDDFNGLTRDDILAYHSYVYTPERIVVGVAGGVPAGKALGVIEKEMNKYHSSDMLYPEIVEEPSQTSEIKEEVFTDITLGYMAIGFHTSSVYSPEIYPGDVLSIILGDGTSSRLFRTLVEEKRLLYTVSSVNYTPKYPGLFVITGIGDPGKVDEAREEIFNVIENIKNNGVNKNELEKARNIALSGYLHSNESIDSIVSTITASEMLTGDPDFMRKYIRDIKKVKESDIEKFISGYLTRDKSTTVFLMPYEYEDVLSGRKDKNKSGGAAAVSFRKEKKGTDEASILRDDRKKQDMSGGILRPATLWKDEISDDEYAGKELYTVLDNGLKLIVKERKRFPIVAVTLACNGGLRRETADNNGISNLTASLMLKGTKKRSEEEIVPLIEQNGGAIKSYSGMNSMGIAMDVLSDDLEGSMDIFEDVVKYPVFPDEEIEKLKEKVLAAIKEQEKSIFDNGIDRLRVLLYGRHPYAGKIIGDEAVVRSVTREDIIKFYRDNISPEEAVLTIVGDVDAEKITKDIRSRFSAWAGDGKDAEDRKVAPLKDEEREDLTMEKEQALFLSGYLGAKVNEDEKYTLDLISAVLSGSDGMLFNDLREEEGLAYTSGAISVPEVDKGYFVIYVATNEESLDKVEKGVDAALGRILSGDIYDADITASKNRLITQKAQSLETNYDISLMMALDELYGVGYEDHNKYEEKINSITKEDIISTAKKVFSDRNRAIVVIHSSLYKRGK